MCVRLFTLYLRSEVYDVIEALYHQKHTGISLLFDHADDKDRFVDPVIR